MGHASLLLAGLLAAPPAGAGPGLPSLTEVQAALNALEACRGLTGPVCPPPYRVYRVHRAQCLHIPPESGREAVACRVDLSLDYPEPDRNFRRRDSCSRYARRANAGSGPEWEVLQIRDRPCEAPSILPRDPHPVPDRPELERALVAMLTCHDTDGITDCGLQPTRANVAEARCLAIAPGAEGRARAACRITASVTYTGGFRTQRLTMFCIRLDRYTAADEDPVLWGTIYVPEEVPCEVGSAERSAAEAKRRGTGAKRRAGPAAQRTGLTSRANGPVTSLF